MNYVNVTCSKGCADGLKSDRQHGLIYGPYLVEGKPANMARWCAYSGECGYCRADLPTRRAAWLRRKLTQAAYTG